MIDKIGVKTTIPELVAYKKLKPGENEIVECAKLSRVLHDKGLKHMDPNMVLYSDPSDKEGCSKEVLIPVDKKVDGVDTKIMPEMKVVFLVYIGANKPVEYYYDTLYKYIEENGLKMANEACSIEAVFQPDEFTLSYGSFIDEDTPEHWRNEIMIQIDG
ncbi:MAG: hypothetical protein NWE89_02400 [Candidatus Bathyarchaeota archaeon]|nr:hypothetical protein [Candidatus Bathyarchaeota archaeon]